MKSVSSSSLAIHPAISPQSVANQMKVVGSHDELPICSSNDDSLSVNIEKTSTPLLTQSDSDSSSKHVSPNSHYSLRVLEQCRPQKSKKVVPKGLKKACGTSSQRLRLVPHRLQKWASSSSYRCMAEQELVLSKETVPMQ